MVTAHLAAFEVRRKRGDENERLNLSERAIESTFERYSVQTGLDGREYLPKHRP